MSGPAHPSTFLPSTVADILRSNAAAAEINRDLTPDQLALVYDQQWFRMLMPENTSMPQPSPVAQPLPLPELVRLEEGLSWADGSVGWTVTLCSGAGWFAGFFAPTAYPEILSNAHLCLAGSGAPSGEAHVIPGGYRVNGRWEYASGSLHATAFTANCVIVANGQKVLTKEGAPLIRPFLFRKEEVVVEMTWNTIGLIATGSHSFRITNIEVPADRCFIIEAAHATDKHPIYRYPFLQLAEATLAANLSGMAIHFLDCCADLFGQRAIQRNFSTAAVEEMQYALNAGTEEMNSLRREFFIAVEESWPAPEDQAPENHLLSAVSRTARTLATGARQIVDQLYPYGGLGAARPDTEINRVWRDFHTASQHNLLVFRR